ANLAGGYLAEISVEQAGNRAQRRGLSGSVRTEEDHYLSVRHFKIDAAQDLDDAAVNDVDIGESKAHRGVPCCVPASPLLQRGRIHPGVAERHDLALLDDLRLGLDLSHREWRGVV